MENHSHGDIIGSPQAPYIDSLAAECGLAAIYHNISHPSLPNYLGATWLNNCQVARSTIGYRPFFGRLAGGWHPGPLVRLDGV
jgi:hypothetical protein